MGMGSVITPTKENEYDTVGAKALRILDEQYRSVVLVTISRLLWHPGQQL